MLMGGFLGGYLAMICGGLCFTLLLCIYCQLLIYTKSSIMKKEPKKKSTTKHRISARASAASSKSDHFSFDSKLLSKQKFLHTLAPRDSQGYRDMLPSESLDKITEPSVSIKQTLINDSVPIPRPFIAELLSQQMKMQQNTQQNKQQKEHPIWKYFAKIAKDGINSSIDFEELYEINSKKTENGGRASMKEEPLRQNDVTDSKFKKEEEVGERRKSQHRNEERGKSQHRSQKRNQIPTTELIPENQQELEQPITPRPRPIIPKKPQVVQPRIVIAQPKRIINTSKDKKLKFKVFNEDEEEQRRYPKRKNRHKPLHFWQREQMVYRKGQCIGYWTKPG